MRAKWAARIRFGILAARYDRSPGRLTPGQTAFLESCQANELMVGDAGTFKAYERECRAAKVSPRREPDFLPGDLVKITLSPGDPCAEFSNRQGVVTYGPDDSYVTGWQVSAMGSGLRCVASELTMITPREDR